MPDSEPQSKRLLPHEEVCRAKRFGGFLAFAVCLTEGSQNCVYQIAAADKALCMHPSCAEIVVRTNSAKR